jgi:hypothetical protein
MPTTPLIDASNPRAPSPWGEQRIRTAASLRLDVSQGFGIAVAAVTVREVECLHARLLNPSTNSLSRTHANRTEVPDGSTAPFRTDLSRNGTIGDSQNGACGVKPRCSCGPPPGRLPADDRKRDNESSPFRSIQTDLVVYCIGLSWNHCGRGRREFYDTGILVQGVCRSPSMAKPHAPVSTRSVPDPLRSANDGSWRSVTKIRKWGKLTHRCVEPGAGCLAQRLAAHRRAYWTRYVICISMRRMPDEDEAWRRTASEDGNRAA